MLKSKLPQRSQEEFNLSPKQVKLYRLAVYGIEALTDEERKNLSFQENLNITRRQSKAQRLINRWKQEITSKAVDTYLSKVFPQSKLIKQMQETTEYTNDKVINPFSFKDLGITQQKLVDKLILWEILPEDFYNIK